MFTLILKSAILCLICFFLFAKLGQWLGRKKASESPKSGALTPKSKPIASVQLMTDVPGSLTPVTSHSPEEVSIDLSQLNSDELEALIANAKSEEPETLKMPKGAADDLKLINGIGPVNEKELKPTIKVLTCNAVCNTRKSHSNRTRPVDQIVFGGN